MINSEYKVAIVCITYNHEKYIKQTIESFLMQKTEFKFTVIIADDCSKDSTPDIIREYAAKYPDIIKAVLRDKNIGPMNNFKSAMSYCSSEYLALCEGDDYWTDENKIKKQIESFFNLELHKLKKIIGKIN